MKIVIPRFVKIINTIFLILNIKSYSQVINKTLANVGDKMISEKEFEIRY